MLARDTLRKQWAVLVHALGLGFILWLGVGTAVQAGSKAIVSMQTSCPGGATVYVNSGASGANNGASWSNAFASLQDALALADSCATVNEIWVAKGVYYPDEGSGQTNNNLSATFQLRNNVAIYGGFAGHETLLAERNWQTNVTVLSGDLEQNDSAKDPNGVTLSPVGITGANAYRVVSGNNITSSAILDGFTITGGKADGASTSRCSQRCGGGINNDQSSPTLRNLTIVGNYAHSYGGGIYNVSSNPILENVAIKANQAALYGGGMNNNSSNPTMTNILFSGNLATSRGGALYNSSSNPLIVNATMSGNRAGGRAGALYNTNNSNPELVNVVIWNNDAPNNPEIENDSGSSAFRHSLIKGSGGSSNWNTLVGHDGGNNLDENPRFVTSITTNSAPTVAGDFHLLSRSPAADAGLSSANLTTSDVDGVARHQSAAVDMGAYESAYTAQLTIAQWRTPAVIEFHETITYTVVVSNSGEANAYQTLLTNTLPMSVTFANWQSQPAGASYNSAGNTVSWTGRVDTSQAVTLTFAVTHTGKPNETVTNTVEISHPTGGGSATSTFAVLPLPIITIADTTAPEAAEQATFTVTLSAPTRKMVSLGYTTSANSATSPADFTATTDVLTIPPGVQTATITIPVNNDEVDEQDENFQIILSNPLNASLGNDRATATIEDDDTAGNMVAPINLTVREPDQSAFFTITLSSQPETPVTVALSSSDSTECSIPASVVLNASNWKTGVAVKITAVDDDVVDGDQPCTIQTTVSSADPNYHGMVMQDISVTVQSEDVAGVNLTPSALTVSEPNSAMSLTITLNSQPVAPVQISLVSVMPTECNAPAQITLNETNWRAGIIVAVNAIDDDFNDGDQSCTIKVSAASSDPTYNAIAVADLVVTVQDNDVAGVAVTPTTLTLREPNTAGSFTLRLTSRPRSPVTIGLTSSDSSECKVGMNSITFDGANWNVSIVVPVTAVDDEIDDGDQSCMIRTTVTSNDSGYHGIAADDVAVTVQDDNDMAGMVVSSTALTISEPSGTASYLLALTSQPIASVVVNLTTSDPSECRVPASITLTASNWRTGRSITVTAVDDFIIDGAQSCVVQATATSSDANYAGMTAEPVTVTVQDNDTAGVLFSLNNATINEADGTVFIVAKLTSQPFAPVTIELANSDPTECTLPTKITLDSSNWQTGVGFTVMSVDDDLDDEAQLCTIQTTAISADSHYHALAVEDLSITVEDDESAGFVVTPAKLTVSEPDSTATFVVALTSEPTATVTLNLTSSDEGECRGPATLLLDPLNWRTGVTATIAAQDDRIADGPRPCTLMMAATSADGDYNELAVDEVVVTVKDDDTAGVIIAPMQVTVQEPEGTATFTITLTSEPTAPVTITLTANEPRECTTPRQVSLDPTNWEQGIAVTVTAVDDAIDDGDQLCIVQTTVASPDATYAGIAAADVTVTVQDDGDTAGVIVATTALTVSEPASSATFTMVLTSEPTAPVTMTITPDNQQCGATPALVFTAQDWQQAQVVTVFAIDDHIVDGDRPCTLHTAATSADTHYHALAADQITVTVQDDGDTAGITVNPTELSISEPHGQSTFLIALTSEPTATVTFELSSDDSSECTTLDTITLDVTNWVTGVPVPVFATDDQLDDGPQPCHIHLAARSSDHNYHQQTIQPVAVTVQDNDVVAMQVVGRTSAATAQLGETITYTYRITNSGDVTLTLQALDPQLGTIVFTPQVIAPKGVAQGSRQYTLRESDAPGPLQTTLTVTGTAAMGTIVTAESATTVAMTIMPEIDVQLERLGPPQITEGAVVTYQLSITNTGFVSAVVESMESTPNPLMAAATNELECATPLMLIPQRTHRCLIFWKSVRTESDTIEFTVTLRLKGPLQSAAILNSSAIVVISGPTEATLRLFLPVVKR